MDIFNKHEEEQKRKEIKDKIQAEDKQRRINFGVTFATQQGFEVLKDLAVRGHFMEQTFAMNDARDSDFRQGERGLLLYILSQLSDELKSKLMGG
jgi:phage FluMu gp28-like protein